KAWLCAHVPVPADQAAGLARPRPGTAGARQSVRPVRAGAPADWANRGEREAARRVETALVETSVRMHDGGAGQQNHAAADRLDAAVADGTQQTSPAGVCWLEGGEPHAVHFYLRAGDPRKEEGTPRTEEGTPRTEETGSGQGSAAASQGSAAACQGSAAACQ